MNVALSEVQLLRKEVHHYQLNARDIELAWSEIGQSMVEMQRSSRGEGKAPGFTVLSRIFRPGHGA